MQGPSRKRKKRKTCQCLPWTMRKKLNQLRRNSTAHSLSYQTLPDASPQHYPTHSPKVHRNMKTSHWEGDTLVGRGRKKKGRHSEGTQEEKWITVRGRVDWRTGGLGEPICRRGSFPLPRKAQEAKCSTTIFRSDHTETVGI